MALSRIRRRLGVLQRLGSSLAQRLRAASLSSVWAIPGIGLLLGCSSPAPTFQQALSGQVEIAAEDREALAELLRVNALEPQTLTLLSPGFRPAAR